MSDSEKVTQLHYEERHVCPLQLDVIDRCLVLWSNPGDIVLSPFMGIGSEVYEAVRLGRRGIGIELKLTYYRQANKSVAAAAKMIEEERAGVFAAAVKQTRCKAKLAGDTQ